MSGELTLKRGGGWRTVAAVLITVMVGVAVVWLVLARLGLRGLPLSILSAALAYALYRLFYPAAAALVGRGEPVETVVWTLSAAQLRLGEDVIPLDTIKTVHCWPDRNALGNTSQGWTVNIETTGKNRLLRSLSEGEEARDSAARLRALVTALGFASQWSEG